MKTFNYQSYLSRLRHLRVAVGRYLTKGDTAKASVFLRRLKVAEADQETNYKRYING